MSPSKSSYTPSPDVPPELMPRLAMIVEVLAGLKSVSEAARSLGLSRNHFQTILHRGVLALVHSIALKPGGRPARPPEIATLQAQLVRLKRENARLHKRVDSTDQLLEVASGLLHGRIRASGRQRRTRRSGGSGDRHEDSDPEGRRQGIVAGVRKMRLLGVSANQAARIAGVHASTLRRWRVRSSSCSPTHKHPSMHVTPEAAARAEDLVRRLHGLIGAEALRHSIEGLSRRAAASVKAHTLTVMERERKASLMRVTITHPGVLRGLDAMHLNSLEGPFFTLIAADGAVPYRTALTSGSQYDATLVARTLREDFEHNGAPLVVRLDRASAHQAPEVREVLDAHAVLTLHGPPRYPSFYGQLERQNREHRAWLEPLEASVSRECLELCLQQMLEAVNTLWRRRSLQWRTAAEIWNAQPRLRIDRVAFREEVHERATRIARTLTHRGQPADLAERLAIEKTLQHKDYLRQKIGGWC